MIHHYRGYTIEMRPTGGRGWIAHTTNARCLSASTMPEILRAIDRDRLDAEEECETCTARRHPDELQQSASGHRVCKDCLQ